MSDDPMRRVYWEFGLAQYPDEESERLAVKYMAENRQGDAPRDEFGNLFIIGYNVPSQDQLAKAESSRVSCQKCKRNHQTWERCSPNQKEVNQMALSLLITDVTDDQIAQIRGILAEDGDASPAVESVKGKKGKKDKKSKEAPIETTAVETEADTEPEAVETFTKKKLEKKERAELISISEALSIPETETKGKRVPTLVDLILAKQEALANAGDEGDDDDFEAEDEDGDVESEWEEDVPPADDDEPKKSKKDKKGKKKGKKKKN